MTSATAKPSRIHEVTVAGERAYSMTVRAADRDRYTTTAQRTELAQGNPSKVFAEGDRKMRAGEERWIAERICIPATAPTGDTSYGFYALNQFKVDGLGGPAASLRFEEDRLIVDRAKLADVRKRRANWICGARRWFGAAAGSRSSGTSGGRYRADGFIELFGDLRGGVRLPTADAPL